MEPNSSSVVFEERQITVFPEDIWAPSKTFKPPSTMNPAPIEVFGRPIGVLAPLLFILLTNTYVIWFLLSRKRDGGLSSLPTIGTRNELFSWSRATLRSLVSTRDWAFEGYYKVFMLVISQEW